MNLFNTKNLKEEYLSKENILKYVSEYDIYSHYLGNVIIGDITNSPFREDKSPSFGIFVGKYGDLAFNDFRLGGGDVITFVSWIEHCDFKSAMSIINKKFNLGLLDTHNIDLKGYSSIDYNKGTDYIKSKKSPKISIQIRNWTKFDLEYWSPLDVKLFRDTYPIEFFWIDEQLYNTHQLAYAYRYDTNVYKIYQPLLEVKHGKWWSNISINNPWFGYNHLSDKGELLFITSSNKDKFVLNQCGFEAIAPHTEAQIFSKEQYEEYSSRFDRIIVFYDNDETGLLKAEKFCEAYKDITYLALEDEDTKDPFEFIKQYGLEELKEWIWNLI